MASAEEQKCANCGFPAPLSYCPSCGQKVVTKPPSVLEIFHDFYSQFTKVDSKGIRTILTLVLSPGKLSKDYVEGKRARYLTPLKIFLLISAFYVGLFWAYSNDIRDMNALSEAGRRSYNDLEYAQVFIPKAPIEEQRERSYQFFKFVYTNLAAMYVVLLPVFAAVLRALYWRGKLLYVEHLVFAAHFQAFAFLVMISEPFLQRVGLTWIPYVISIVYLVFAMKRFYEQSWPKTLLKALLFVLGFAVVILAAIFGVAAYFMLVRQLA
jgi:hypothetical protein